VSELQLPTQELTVEIVKEPSPEWDAFVRCDAHGTFCHLAGWHGVLSDSMGHEALYLTTRHECGAVAGVLPLFLVHSRLFGRHMVSVPLLNCGGPLGRPAPASALVAEAIRLAHSRGVASVELRSRVRMDTGLNEDYRKVSVQLPLPSTAEALWAGFRAKLRSQIRRPMNEGMEVRYGSSELPAFYEVYCRNMRDRGTPTLPRAVFQSVADTFGSEAVFGAVYHRDRTVAAGAGVLFNGEFEMTWASSLREYNRHAPNMLLYWSFMERMIQLGAHTFNFGRCTPGQGTHRFKLQWGGSDVPLPWQVWRKGGAANGAGTPGKVARFGAAAWQRLPVSIANRAGPTVARQLPWW
jgi:serine/alanine adding enzyme